MRGDSPAYPRIREKVTKSTHQKSVSPSNFYLKGLVPSTAIWKGGIKIKKIIKILNSKISRFSRESYKIENIKIIRHWLLRNLNVTGTIKCIIYHEHLASLIVKTLEQHFLSFHLTVERTSCIYFVMIEAIILIFLRDLKTKLCKHNQKRLT